MILDAGHGGSDPGTVSGQLLEKDITLDINLRLERMLKQAGFEVMVTRHDDRTVPLRQRALVAEVVRVREGPQVVLMGGVTHARVRRVLGNPAVRRRGSSAPGVRGWPSSTRVP